MKNTTKVAEHVEEQFHAAGHELVNVTKSQTDKLASKKRQRFKSRIGLHDIPEANLSEPNSGGIAFTTLNINNEGSPEAGQKNKLNTELEIEVQVTTPGMYSKMGTGVPKSNGA